MDMLQANYTRRPPVFEPVDTRYPEGSCRYNYGIKREAADYGESVERESWICNEITVASLNSTVVKEALIDAHWTQGEREALINNYNAAMNGQADSKYIKAYEDFNRKRKQLKRQVDNDLREYLGVARTLADAVKEKLSHIEDYDTSESVNSFTVNGIPCWIDKNTRAVYRGIISTAKGKGDATIGLSLGGMVIPGLPVSMAESLLDNIEYYAYTAAMVTAAHKAAVARLASIEDVDTFDYTAGYPEKVTINLPAL